LYCGFERSPTAYQVPLKNKKKAQINLWENIHSHLTKAGSIHTSYTVKTYESYFNPLTPNNHYSGRTTPLTSKCCILYIYSTNIDTEFFKHGIHSPVFFFFSLSLQNAVCFIILMYLVPVLFTFYMQDVLKFKK